MWSEESFCTKRHYAWDDYSSLSNTEQFSRYDPKLFSSRRRSFMFKQTFKVKEAKCGIKITLEHFCWRTHGVQSESDSFSRKTLCYYTWPCASPYASLVLTCTQAVIRMQSGPGCCFGPMPRSYSLQALDILEWRPVFLCSSLSASVWKLNTFLPEIKYIWFLIILRLYLKQGVPVA